jgi:hypothetical protein
MRDKHMCIGQLRSPFIPGASLFPVYAGNPEFLRRMNMQGDILDCL